MTEQMAINIEKKIEELTSYINKINDGNRQEDLEEEDCIELLETLATSLNISIEIINALNESIDDFVKENELLKRRLLKLGMKG